MQRLIQPVLISMGASLTPRPAAASSDWQASAEELFRAAHRVEVHLSVSLGVSPGGGTTDRLPSDLLYAMSELRADLDQCRKLLAVTEPRR